MDRIVWYPCYVYNRTSTKSTITELAQLFRKKYLANPGLIFTDHTLLLARKKDNVSEWIRRLLFQ
jgi:hypothetical protein